MQMRLGPGADFQHEVHTRLDAAPRAHQEIPMYSPPAEYHAVIPADKRRGGTTRKGVTTVSTTERTVDRHRVRNPRRESHNRTKLRTQLGRGEWDDIPTSLRTRQLRTYDDLAVS